MSGIDINMGCPKKFSLQAGMGAALLSNVETATDVSPTWVQALACPNVVLGACADHQNTPPQPELASHMQDSVAQHHGQNGGLVASACGFRASLADTRGVCRLTTCGQWKLLGPWQSRFTLGECHVNAQCIAHASVCVDSVPWLQQ